MEGDKMKLTDKINVRRRVSIDLSGVGRTKQAFKGECDINNIVARYRVTGELPSTRRGYFADVTRVPEYREALEVVSNAQAAFDSLPAKVRNEFMNDPAVMLAFLEKPENMERAIELGLVDGKPNDATSKGGQVEPPPPPPPKDIPK